MTPRNFQQCYDGSVMGEEVDPDRLYELKTGLDESGIYLQDEVEAFSRLIDLINERFGAELSEADQLFFDQIAEAASQNESLRQAAEVNSLDTFQMVFRQVLESLFIERMGLNEELFIDYMSKPD